MEKKLYVFTMEMGNTTTVGLVHTPIIDNSGVLKAVLIAKASGLNNSTNYVFKNCTPRKLMAVGKYKLEEYVI